MSRRSCDSPEATQPGKCGWDWSQVSPGYPWDRPERTVRGHRKPAWTAQGPESRAGPTTAPGQALLLCLSRVYWSRATRSSTLGRGPLSGSEGRGQ